MQTGTSIASPHAPLCGSGRIELRPTRLHAVLRRTLDLARAATTQCFVQFQITRKEDDGYGNPCAGRPSVVSSVEHPQTLHISPSGRFSFKGEGQIYMRPPHLGPGGKAPMSVRGQFLSATRARITVTVGPQICGGGTNRFTVTWMKYA